MSEERPVARGLPAQGRAVLLVAVLACLLGVMFWRTGHWMVVRWEQPNSYYGHGWLIPPVAAFLLYRRREEIAACARRPCAAGLLLLVPAVLVHLVGTALQLGFVTGFALLGVLGGLALTLGGPALLRLTAFPILFLAFMVPVPAVLIETASFRLKMLAARAATSLVEVLGVVAVRQGSYIRLTAGALVVDDVCSGLKYLISLTAFGALYAHLSRLRFWGKALIFLLSVPIAFAANVLRVTLMILAAEASGVQAVGKWYFHDLFGFLLFIVAFVLLFLVESALLGEFRVGFLGGGPRTAPRSKDRPTSRPEPIAVGPPLGRALQGGTLALMAGVAALSVFLYWPRAVPAEEGRLASIPLRLAGWTGLDYTLDERTLEILGTRDVLSRSYDKGSERVQLLIVWARQARRRTHPPEECFAGEGYRIAAERERPVGLAMWSLGGRDFSVQELVLDRGDERRLVWYFYKSGDRLNTSYWAHQLGVVLRKLADPGASDVLVRADTRVRGGDLDSSRRTLADFLSAFLPEILERVP